MLHYTDHVIMSCLYSLRVTLAFNNFHLHFQDYNNFLLIFTDSNRYNSLIKYNFDIAMYFKTFSQNLLQSYQFDILLAVTP